MNANSGTYCGIGSQNNVGKWNGQRFDNLNLNWSVIQMTSSDGMMYVVGTKFNIGVFNPADSNPTVSPVTWGGNWTIKSLAIQSDGTKWCIGEQGNVGKMLPNTQDWVHEPTMDALKFNCIAVDGNNDVYAVCSEDHKVYKWTDNTNWKPNPDTQWNVVSVSFDAMERMWIVGANGNVGLWSEEFNTVADYGKLDNWELIAFV